LIDKERRKAREDSPWPQVPQGGEQQCRYCNQSLQGVRKGEGHGIPLAGLPVYGSRL